MMRIGVLLAILLNVWAVYGQHNSSYTLEDLVEESDILVEGRIIEKKPFYGLDGLIYTNYGLEIHFVYKGVDVDNVVHFVSLGGTMEDEALVVCPSLHFQEGETGLVGLRDTRIPRVKEQCYIPVSADRSWLKINYTDRLAFDFHSSVLKLNDLRQKLQRLTKQPSWQVVAPPGESAQESMVTITGISPLITQAGRGQEITITGSGFGATQGVGEVLFRDVNYSSSTISRGAVIYNSWSDTQIKVIVPYNAGSGSIKVQNNVGVLSPASSQSLSITYNVVNVNLSEYTYHIDHNQDGNGGYNFVYSTNTNNGGVDFTSIPAAVSAIGRATTTWNNGSGFTIFTEQACGTTLAQEPGRDGNNLFTFDNDLYDLDVRRGSSVLGVMFSYYSRCNSEWELVEMDMVLRRDGNPNGFGGSVNWEYGPAAPSGGEADFESVVLHELGHGHQLGHCRVSGAVMYPVITLGTTRRNLTSSETSGGGYVQSQSTGYVPPVTGGCPPPQNSARQYFNYNASHRCSIVLPLELMSFQAKARRDNTIEIAWATQNEIDHRIIELQYLTENSSKWETLVSYESRGGQGNTANYSFVHKDLIPATYLYRLVIHSNTGHLEYSEIRSAEIQTSEFSFSALVLGDDIKIEVISEDIEKLEIEIFTVGGGRIHLTMPLISHGADEMTIPCGTWRTGIYILKWQNLTTGARGTQRLFID